MQEDFDPPSFWDHAREQDPKVAYPQIVGQNRRPLASNDAYGDEKN